MSTDPTTNSVNTNLSDVAYKRLRELIETGEIQSGDRITEHGASERLGLGRGPVREAMLRLQVDGMIRQPSSGSCRVVHYEDHDSTEMIVAREELRLFIYAGAAELATLNMNGRQISRLGEILDDLNAARVASKRAALITAYWEHIVNNCGNALFKQVFHEYHLSNPIRFNADAKAQIEKNHAGLLNQIGWLSDLAAAVAAHQQDKASKIVSDVYRKRIEVIRSILPVG